MNDPHSQVEPFFDGRLSPEEAEAFRRHYATCEECDRRLGELMAMEVLLEDRRQRAPVSRPLPRQEGFLERLRRYTPALVGAVALATVVVVVRTGVPSPGESLSPLAMRPDPEGRVIAGRSAYPEARGYQPLKQGHLGGGGAQVAPPPSDDLLKLERRNDVLGKVAVYLVRGQLPGAALKALAPLSGPDAESERALAYLVRGDGDAGDLEEAVRRADAALAQDKTHGPALWNKALALKQLGLVSMAAGTFDAVAAQGEDGWAKEARSEAAKLRDEVGRTRAFVEEATRAGEALVSTGQLPEDRYLPYPELRWYFYEAVRTRTSAEDVQKLMPLAAKLDAQHHQSYAQEYVSWVAGRDFKARAPLVKQYAQLPLEAPRDSASVASLWKSGEDDLAVGAMSRTEAAGGPELTAFATRCQNLRNPWFDILALQRRARASRQGGDAKGAIALLEQALERSREARLDYREIHVARELLELYVNDSDLEKAYELFRSSWGTVTRDSDWENQRELIAQMGQLARLRDDVPLAKAYLLEAEARAGSKMGKLTRFIEENLAFVESIELHAAEARQHLKAATDTGLPLTTSGAFALADVARMSPDPAVDRPAMEAFRASLNPADPVEYALGLHELGRWKIETDPDEGRRLIRESMERAAKAPQSPDAHRVLTYGYTSLIMDAGKRRDFDAVLDLVQKETGERLPSCAAMITQDSERSVVLARGPDGALAGEYDGARKKARPANLEGYVTPPLLAKLAGCPEVHVMARPPLVGRPGALPGNVAWSYLLPGKKAAGEPAPGGSPHPLVVQSPQLSDRRVRQLSPLHDWLKPAEHPELTFLTGAQATPSAVLSAMRSADQIAIVTHSLVNPNSGEAYLVLAEDPDQEDRLRASQLQPGTLERRPLVLLVACEAATPAPVFWASHSLPSQLIGAGARAVLAAADQIPEDEGPAFFDEVRKKINGGSSPTMALRDTRLAWQGGGVRNWVDSVLLFE